MHNSQIYKEKGDQRVLLCISENTNGKQLYCVLGHMIDLNLL